MFAQGPVQGKCAARGSRRAGEGNFPLRIPVPGGREEDKGCAGEKEGNFPAECLTGRKIRDAREKRERNFPAGIQAGWKVKAHASGEKAEEVEF